MKVSLNEVMSLAAKAARGAGAPAAQAANYGRAAVRHLCAERPADDLKRALAALPEGPVMTLPLWLAGPETGRFESGEWDVLAASYVEALPYEAKLDDAMTLTFDLERPANRASEIRCELPKDLKEFWSDLAAKTLVPESDESRISGAGAGLSDND